MMQAMTGVAALLPPDGGGYRDLGPRQRALVGVGEGGAMGNCRREPPLQAPLTGFAGKLRYPSPPGGRM